VSVLLSYFNGLEMHHAVSLRMLSRTIVSRPVLFAVVPFSEASTVCTALPFESGPLFNREESN
jgi:hypothetical protein